MKQLLLLLSFVLCAQARASDPAANATAKFLAGLPVKGTPLESRSADPAWIAHATELDRAWERMEKEQFSKIRAWAPQSIGPSYEDRGVMYYMFSGPDFLYANTFFPNASTYILCGIEPVGSLPDIEKIPQTILPPALAGLRKSLESVLSLSYFITKFMQFDLKQAQLDGTLPVLYIFLARAGCTIDSVTLVALDREGNFVPKDKGTTPGVKIVFSRPGGREQTLYYFKSDLADKGIKANPAFRKFCERQGKGVALLKAACYFMQSDNFSIVRHFLLTHSKVILQDDSGIPVLCLDSDKWDVRWYKDKADTDIKARPLEFSFGYRGKQTGSSVMVATPK